MTCNILEGYVSETAKNCIANPPWGEGCEICVKAISPIQFTILIFGCIIILSLIYVIFKKQMLVELK